VCGPMWGWLGKEATGEWRLERNAGGQRFHFFAIRAGNGVNFDPRPKMSHREIQWMDGGAQLPPWVFHYF
jgi:hypothetical protein